MSDEIRHPKKVTIDLDRPYVTNDVYLGHEDNDRRKPFVGRVTVTEDVAEDIKRRQAEWAKYDASRHRDNGRSVQAGSIQG